MDLEHKAIERIKIASDMSLTYYGVPLIVMDSGGKDSAVNLALTLRAGVPFEVEHNHTTADAPQTVYHVRHTFKCLEEKGTKCKISHPLFKGQHISMWSLIPLKLMPPTRLARYCCEILKEQSGKNRLITTGVRWDESAKRKNRGIYETIEKNKEKRIILNNDNDEKRQLFENCSLKAKRVCNPIIDWKDSDVWNFIGSEKIETNPLYKCGFKRVGCIGCPIASKNRYFEFRMFPQYEKMYRSAFGRMLEMRKSAGKPTEWKTVDEVFHWWMEDKNVGGQIPMDGWEV
jgi:3'-phosphoadenosine 5'-phosphosulfate sulfotransferase (PAPS reductase)/FAD synthetase